jgi:nucleotide-binding universal stress UspA family protein
VIELVPALLKIRSILVPVDFSPPSKKALHYAAQLAGQFNSTLTLLHVVEPVAMPDFAYFPLAQEIEETVKAARARMTTLCEQEGISTQQIAKTLIRHGRAFHEITEAARTLKSDMIVIATHGFTGVKHVLMGSTAERVVRHAPCPVLTVRIHERDFA